MKPYKVIISGGGTGGHIFPALAIAKGLQEVWPEVNILFVGARGRMEMTKIPEAGFPIKGLWITGIQRKITLQNLLFPLKLFLSIIKSHRIISKFKPQLVIGTGGFASGPLLKAAAQRGIPLLVQEQNSYPGITNKWLAKNAQLICVAYKGMEKYFPPQKIRLTGNPIRHILTKPLPERDIACSYFNVNPQKKVLLVLGGSLGAKRINMLIASKINFFESLGIEVIWQCGQLYYEQYRDASNTKVKAHAFIKDMAMAYAAANFIISRAGALSVSELSQVGKPVMFIPSPNVAENHQYKNAQALVRVGAAICMEEKDLDADFEQSFENWISNQAQLNAQETALKSLAKPKATQDIVTLISQIITKE